MDVVSISTRSRMMAGIKGKNTKPEMLIRRSLHRRGLRYRLHNTNLPGTPDLTCTKFRAVLFIHGCFWHGHDCKLFRWPSTREEFWRKKIGGNRVRDARQIALLLSKGWRVCIVWECAIRGASVDVNHVCDSVVSWIRDIGTESVKYQVAG